MTRTRQEHRGTNRTSVMANVLTPMPSLMTNRARAFLIGTSIMLLALGYFLVLQPDVWKSSSYDTLKLLPLWVWGAVMAITSGFLAASGMARSAHIARVTLCVAAVICGVWTFAFLAAYFNGFLAGPSGPIVWAYATFVQLLQVVQPMRMPMEEVIQRETRAQHHRG